MATNGQRCTVLTAWSMPAMFGFDRSEGIAKSPKNIFYHADNRPRSIETLVHLELTMIKSHHGHLNVAISSSVTSVFYNAKRRKG